ncbi:hypothetical protein TVAG_114050, partial [Trichomonas vaginalis G3]
MIEGETDEFEIHFSWLKTVVKRIDSYESEETRLPLLSLEFCAPIRKFEHQKYPNNEITQNDIKTALPYAIIINAISESQVEYKDPEITFTSIIDLLSKMGYKPSSDCIPQELANENLTHHTALCLVLEWLIVDKSLTIDDICKDLQRLPRSYFILEHRPTMLDEAVLLWLSKFSTIQNLPPCKDLSTNLLNGQHMAAVLSRVFPQLINQKEIQIGENLNEDQINKNWDLIHKVTDSLNAFVPPRRKLSQQLLYTFIADIFSSTRPAAKKFVKLDQPKPIELLPMPVSQEPPKQLVQQLPKQYIPYVAPIKPPEKPKPAKKETKPKQKSEKKQTEKEENTKSKDQTKEKEQKTNETKPEQSNESTKENVEKTEEENKAMKDENLDVSKVNENKDLNGKTEEENKAKKGENLDVSKENETKDLNGKTEEENKDKDVNETQEENKDKEVNETKGENKEKVEKQEIPIENESQDDKKETENNEVELVKERDISDEENDKNKETEKTNELKEESIKEVGLSLSSKSSKSSENGLTQLQEESLHESNSSNKSKSSHSKKSNKSDHLSSSSLNQVIVLSDTDQKENEDKMKYKASA